MSRSPLGVFAPFVLIAACGAAIQRDSSGHAVFIDRDVLHVAGTGYECFSFVAADGSARSECSLTTDACAYLIQKATGQGIAVTSACHASDEVYCYTYYVRGASDWRCWASEDDCIHGTRVQASIIDNGDDVSMCRRLDRTFAPTS